MEKDLPVLGGLLENREHPNPKGWLRKNSFSLTPKWTLKMMHGLENSILKKLYYVCHRNGFQISEEAF